MKRSKPIDEAEEMFRKRMKTTHVSDLPQRFPQSTVLVNVLQYLPSIYSISCECALVSKHWHSVIHSHIDVASELLWYRVAHRPEFKHFEYSIVCAEYDTKMDAPFRDSRRWYACVRNMISSSRDHYLNSVFYCLTKQFDFNSQLVVEYIEESLIPEEQEMMDQDTMFDPIPFQIEEAPSSILEDLEQFEKQIPVGTSKIGGYPDLPKGVDWPTFNPLDSIEQVIPNVYDPPICYDFIAQFNLPQMSEHFWDKNCAIPDDGMLYIFYHADGEKSLRIDKKHTLLYYSSQDIKKLGGLQRCCNAIDRSKSSIQISADKIYPFALKPSKIKFAPLKALPKKIDARLTHFIVTHHKHIDFEKAQNLFKPLQSATFGASGYESEYFEKMEELRKLFPLRVVNCNNALLLNNQNIIREMLHELECWEDTSADADLQEYRSLDPKNWLSSIPESQLRDPNSYTIIYSPSFSQIDNKWAIIMRRQDVLEKNFQNTIIYSQ